MSRFGAKMTDSIRSLKVDYESMRPAYKELCRQLEIRLAGLARDEAIALAFPVASRTKTWDSILDKVDREALAPTALSEIYDLAGLRVVVVYRRDMERVRRLIRRNFEVTWVEDTGGRLAADQFGYGSVHFQIRLAPEDLSVPSLELIRGLDAEVQVRTAAQHIWAVGSHELQYKPESTEGHRWTA